MPEASDHRRTRGYFLCADVLGFKQIIKNLPPDAADSRIADWVELVERCARSNGVADYQLVSDTVFAGAVSTADGLKSLIGFSRQLLMEGVTRSFLVRGGISHGDYVWGRLTYGRAVVTAYEIEASQDWVGVSCAPELPHVNELWGVDALITFPAFRKSGPVVLVPVVGWDVPPYGELAKSSTAGGLAPEGTQLQWDWASKIERTVQFGIYRRELRRVSADPRHFYGSLPIEAIEVLVPAATAVQP